MSDDEADPELLALLRESLGIGVKRSDEVSEDTGRSQSQLSYILSLYPYSLGNGLMPLQESSKMPNTSTKTPSTWSQTC